MSQLEPRKIRTDKQQKKAWMVLLQKQQVPSVYELAKRINTPYTTVVHALERDIAKMSLGMALAIASEFGVSVESLTEEIRFK